MESLCALIEEWDYVETVLMHCHECNEDFPLYKGTETCPFCETEVEEAE